MNNDTSFTMASQICHQILSVFSPSSPLPPPLQLLVKHISLAAAASHKIFLHGVGREGLMLKSFCMRLHHLALPAHLVGDITTPPISSGDLLIASAGPGPGAFSTVDAICRVSKSAGARVLLITARPGCGSETSLIADEVACLPGRTMADDEVEVEGAGGLSLPMGSVYEGAMFVLFEMAVVKLAEELGRTMGELRSRHTNLE